MEMGDEKPVGSPLLAITIALLIAGGGGTYYFYSQYQAVQQELEAAKQVQQQQPENVDVQQLVDEVGKLMELPQEEQPTVATIKDPEKLKDHPFLSRGQKDDRLLIYTNAKLAILYRPGTGKIVSVGTVNIVEGEEEATSSATADEARGISN